MRKLLILLLLTFTISCEDQQIKKECGDFEVNRDGEECDGIDFAGYSCQDFGFYGGKLSCTANCLIDTTGCEVMGMCGDNVIQEAAGEDCDGLTLGGADCESEGYYGGQLTCNSDCRFDYTQCEESGYCGDDIIQTNEDCEGDDLNGNTCQTLGYHGGELLCRTDCKWELTGCVAAGSCGDGIVQTGAGEKCDNFNLGDNTCENKGWWGGILGCSDTCQLEEDSCFDPVKVSAGFLTTCSIDSQGQAWCWGEGMCGQLGDNSTGNPDCYQLFTTGDVNALSVSVDEPVQVYNPDNKIFTDISAGFLHSCAIEATNPSDPTGKVWCWGMNLLLGNSIEAGDATGFSKIPVEVETPAGIKFEKVRIGWSHTCALSTAGDIYCWGDNSYHQLGQGLGALSDFYVIPVKVASTETFIDFDSAAYHNCALNVDNQVFCWGLNNFGQTGTLIGGDNCPMSDEGPSGFNTHCTKSPVKHQDPNLIGFKITVAGGEFDTALATALIGHSCVIGSNHNSSIVDTGVDIWCWGSNHGGQLAKPRMGAEPGGIDYSINSVQVNLPLGINFLTSLDAGYAHTCADGMGFTLCWGLNYTGQLGIGSYSISEDVTFVELPEYQAFRNVSSGYLHTCAMGVGSMWCWGLGDFGQLGVGLKTISNLPYRTVSPE
ncbi:hypothetical protein KKF34_03885 [Myxococcota bacterium]|nr:hypothetical protein [Myxococcota bacterium]MBU1381284.1 hypothetical protein [Myxococcota bacterium]MBU1495996.1 hypothetical protein [Myxococcota bacterium]